MSMGNIKQSVTGGVSIRWCVRDMHYAYHTREMHGFATCVVLYWHILFLVFL
jgi:hypothetical protein